MKISIMEIMYPIIMDRLVKRHLQIYYDEVSLKIFLRKVHRTYRDILRRTPDMGGTQNIFIKNIYMGSYIIAFYKETKDKVSLEELNTIIMNSLNSFDLLKNKMKKMDLSSDEYREKLKKAACWLENTKDKYTENWVLRVPPKVKPRGVYYEFKQCGLCSLCRQEGVPETTPILCSTDFITIGFSNCKLIRTKTLAKGDDCCDFWILPK